MICVLGTTPPRCVAGNHPRDRLSNCQRVLLQVFAHDLRIGKSLHPRCVAGNHPRDRLSNCQRVLLQVFTHDLRIGKSLPPRCVAGNHPTTDCQTASVLCWNHSPTMGCFICWREGAPASELAASLLTPQSGGLFEEAVVRLCAGAREGCATRRVTTTQIHAHDLWHDLFHTMCAGSA